jgi:guanine deaminase
VVNRSEALQSDAPEDPSAPADPLAPEDRAAQDHRYLRRALELARLGMEQGAGGPFGCVIVRDGEVLGEGYNRVLETGDPTAHAEVVAIRAACQAVGDHQLHGATLYASCEPCPMCLGAIYWARPARVVFALTRSDARAIGFDDDFIYDEIVRPPNERTIPFEHLEQEAAASLFRTWQESGDRRLY